MEKSSLNELKKAIIKAISQKIITKMEARDLLRFNFQDRIFRTLCLPNGEKHDLNPEKAYLKEICIKANIPFIHIKRRVIEK